MKRKDAAVEVERLQKLRHTHIIRIVGTYVVGRDLAILLYPVAEWNLGTFLEHKPLYKENYDDGLTKVLTCFPCLANAVEYMHANTVKHMDIKPQNILIKWRQGHLKVYLADFGIARSYTTTPEAETDSFTPFTRKYAAPEVVAQETRGLSADIFSLGCVFTEVLSHFRQHTTRDFWRGKFFFSNEAEENAFHPSAIQNFSYCSNIDTVVSFLWGPIYLFTHSWLDDDTKTLLTFLWDIRSFLIQMLSPKPSLRPSAREVAEKFQTPNSTSKCSCSHESPPFETAIPARIINNRPSRAINPHGEQVVLLLHPQTFDPTVRSTIFSDFYDDDARWIGMNFRERVIAVGFPPNGLWFLDRAPACHQSRPLLTQLASRKCQLLIARPLSRKIQLLLTWPSGGPVVEEGEESEDEVIFEGRR